MEYYEDAYMLLDQNDYDDFNTENNHRKALDKVKALNRGYHTIKRKVNFSNGTSKIMDIGVYGSGCHESPIRNAETGEYYKYKVGTFDEDLFFKVMICTGECQSGPLTLFYDSPQHYERHQYTDVDPDSIRNWENKKQDRLNF
jgi:(2Fe-2S) ferredoxin